MREKLRGVIDTATFRQSLGTFSGTIINGGLGAIFYILTARYLGPAGFGILTVAITVLTLVSDISDLGTDTGLVRFVGKYIKTDILKAKRFLKLGLIIKISVSSAVLLIGWVLSPYLANNIFLKPSLILPLRLAFIGVGSSLLFSFLTHSLQGMSKFWLWSSVQIGSNSLRLILIIILLGLNNFKIDNVMLIYIIVPLIGFIFGVSFLPKGFYKVQNEKSVIKEFFHYNKWVALFTLFAAISARLDTFISARLLSITQLGIYAAATQLTTIVPQVVGALGTVVSPKIASMSNLADLLKYFKKTMILVLILAAISILLIPLAIIIIPVLYGQAYIAAIPLFIILYIGLLFFLLSVPIHSTIFYYYAYPKIFFWLSLINILVVSILGWVLISKFSALGAAITVFISNLINFIIPGIWLWRRIALEKI